jgi:hypothetical protein
MTTKQKPRKAAPAKSIDPIFATIAEHKRLLRNFMRCRDIFEAARSQAEKKHGKRLEGMPLAMAASADTEPLWDQFDRADHAARKGGKRLARTKPTTLAGVAALAAYLHRNYTDEINEDWAEVSFKVVASVLTRMSKEAACAIH